MDATILLALDALDGLETAEVLQSIVDASADGVCLIELGVDGEYRYLAANPAYRRLFFPAEQPVAGRRLAECLPEQVASDLELNCRQCLSGGKSISFRESVDPPGSGRVRETTLLPFTNTSGSVTAIAAVCNQVVEAADRIDTLAQIDRYLPGFIYELEQGPDGAFRYTFLSSGVQALLGVPPAAAMRDANLLLDRIHRDDYPGVMAETAAQAETLAPWRGVFRMVRASDDAIVWIECYDTPQRLGDGGIRWVGYANDVTQRVELEQQIRKLAHFDSLTGLPNRNQFMERADQALIMAQRDGSSLAVLYVDLDGFKAVNDCYGHAVGDEVLRVSADRMGACLRAPDILCRLGGDEFVIVLPMIAGRANAATVATKVLQAVAEPIVLPDQVTRVGASIGVAVYPADGDDLRVLMGQADFAMYTAKRSGSGQIVYADSLGESEHP